MATITWQQGDCRIIKLEGCDFYTDETGYKQLVFVEKYLLLVGNVDLDITPRKENSDYVRVLIPVDTKPEDKPTILLAYKPDPCEWWDQICKSSNFTSRIPEIKEIEYAVNQPQLPIIDEPMFTLKDIILTGLTVAAAVFGIMR